MQVNKNMLIIVIGMAFFMEGLDSTIINTALPQIGHSLNTDPLHLKVALTSYLLAAGMIIPLSGWLADRFGSQRIFMMALMLFLTGSIACGLSHSLTQLVIARIIQGAGGALSMPVGRLLLIRSFDKIELISATALTATFGLMGPSMGPVIGGILTTYVNWRAIFFVNVPIGLTGFYFALKYFPNARSFQKKKFDAVGFFILSLALAAILIGLDTIIEPFFNKLTTAFLIISGFIGVWLYILYAKYHEDALISMQLFKDKNFVYAVTGSVFVRLSIGTPAFLIPLMLQLSFGYSALQSGLFTATSAIGMLITKFFTTRLVTRLGYRTLLLNNSLLLCISLGMLSLIALHPPSLLIVCLLASNGIVTSVQFSSMNSLSYSRILPEFQASGSSFISSFQQILNGFGIALSATVLAFFLHSNFLFQVHSPAAFRNTLLVLACFPLLSIFSFRKLAKV